MPRTRPLNGEERYGLHLDSLDNTDAESELVCSTVSFAQVYNVLDLVGVRVLFLESICDDPAVVEKNILATKLFSPDYIGADPEEAVKDFKNRIANYEKAYESVGVDKSETNYSYLKVRHLNDPTQSPLCSLQQFSEANIACVSH